MKRSGTIHTIHELSAQGKSMRAIAREVGIARNTVRRYLRGKPEAIARPKRGSVLDPYKPQIQRWMRGVTICTTVKSCESGCASRATRATAPCCVITCVPFVRATSGSSRSCAMKRNQGNKCSMTAARAITSRKDKIASSTALRRCSATPACASSPSSNAAIRRR